jgi:hypothetical protein
MADSTRTAHAEGHEAPTEGPIPPIGRGIAGDGPTGPDPLGAPASRHAKIIHPAGMERMLASARGMPCKYDACGALIVASTDARR